MFLWIIWILSYSVWAAALPTTPVGSYLLRKHTIDVSFNPQYKVADWVSYSLTRRKLEDCTKRGNLFNPDPELPFGERSELEDYKGSGYDRGHLSPAGDNRWIRRAMLDSFLLSNIVPQPHRFNQGIWARLESLVRAWAKQAGGAEIVTGPVLRNITDTIGDSKVAVPNYFYKVILLKDRRALAFVMPTNASGNIQKYAVSIEGAEWWTGLDFFPGDPREREIEEQYDPDNWDFDAGFKYYKCSTKLDAIFAEPGFLSFFEQW